MHENGVILTWQLVFPNRVVLTMPGQVPTRELGPGFFFNDPKHG
jgi:hypothetical protein